MKKIRKLFFAMTTLLFGALFLVACKTGPLSQDQQFVAADRYGQAVACFAQQYVGSRNTFAELQGIVTAFVLDGIVAVTFIEEVGIVACTANQDIVANAAVEVVLPSLPTRQSSPAKPYKWLSPELPLMSLFRALPVPLRLPEPCKNRCSTLSVRV